MPVCKPTWKERVAGWLVKPEQRTVAVPEAQSVSLPDWQRSAALVTEARKLFASPFWRLARTVLLANHPINYHLPATGATETDRVAHQTRCEGYNLALNTLDSLSTYNERATPLEATFADANNVVPVEFRKPSNN